VITCGVTTGFFVLRRCGVTAVTGCARCRRPLCADQVAEGGLCPECAAAHGHRVHPAAARAFHRRAFYASSAHSYHDRHFYDSLDDYDRSAFDPGRSSDGEYDPDDGPDDLVDS
jgi:hypothetical protein